MRHVIKPHRELGDIDIAAIKIDPRSRDDIPAILLGLQHLYCDRELRARLFALLEEHLAPHVSHDLGRPGMALWQILVMGVLMQGLNCDYDRLCQFVNHHDVVRRFLGHADIWDRRRYSYQSVVDNVRLLTPELLAKVGQLVVESGHKVSKKKPGGLLHGRCDSFVVETDVHYPTDVNLLWDAMRCLIRECGRAASGCGLDGWRQWRYLTTAIKGRFHAVRKTRWAGPEDVKACLDLCRKLVVRAEGTLSELQDPRTRRLPGKGNPASIGHFIGHAKRQIDQVDRRLLKGETIPHGEKVFSIFEDHTRWISKGKAGVPVELGVPVCIVEDGFGFLLNHRIMWDGSDVDHAVPVIEETQARFPDFRACSFDRGFHSPENRLDLDTLLDHNVLPGKGCLGRADRIREGEETFVAMRRQHPAVESAINNLEHRGLDRVRAHGSGGFERVVGLSVLAFNIHRLGLLIRRRRQVLLKRRRERLPLAA